MAISFKFRFLILSLFSFVGLRAQTTLLVGSGETYTTIAGAYAACTNGATNYIIELRSTYANTEAKPITLGANTALTVKIRPQSGVAAFAAGGATISTGTATSVFSFTAGDNITIDGRAGGAGSSVLIIENTQNAASKYAIQFSGGSTSNTIKYCTVKGSNTDVTYDATSSGVIMFGSGTNSSNTIDNCTVQQSGSNYPAVCINSYDATNNNQISVTNCNIVNFTWFGLFAGGSKNLNWTVTGNSFYADYAQSGWANPVSMIKVRDGGGHTITGNYFGGRAASCGGSAYTLSSTDVLIAVDFTSSTTGTTTTISNNTIQNIAYTSTKTSDQFSAFYIAGAGNFTIGSSGNGNTIGATSGTGNITFTDNSVASSSTYQFILGQFHCSGTMNIQYNTFGALTLNGSNASTKYIRLAEIWDGTITFSNNTIGNTTANNIVYSGAGQNCYGLYLGSTCAGTSTVQNNTWQNIQNSGTAGTFTLIENWAGAINCTGNTIKNISSASASVDHYMVYFSCSGAITLSSNTIYAITLSHASSNSLLMYAYTSSSSTTVSSNTIGQYGVSNDISFAGNNRHAAIYIDGGTPVVSNSNVIQNITCSSTGSSNRLYGLLFNGASTTLTANDNAIDNLSSASTRNGNNVVVGIWNGTGVATTTFTHNSISNLSATTTSATAGGYVYGIYITSAPYDGSITKNRISGLTNTSTLGSTNTAIAGIRIDNTFYSWNVYNNVVIIDNSSNTNYVAMSGIYSEDNGTNTFYHNTVKVGGTASGADNSYALRINIGAGTNTIKNNIFQNKRSGGTGKHYAIANTTTGSTFTEDYNYLEAAAAGTVGIWSATDKTYAAWNTSSGAANNKNGTITIASNGSVPAGTTSDVKTNGADLNAIVTDDLDGNARADASWRGAYETTTPLPIELLSFTATARGQVVDLNWITVTETNNDYFTLERSADGTEFESIAVVDGAGNSNATLYYKNTDTRPLKGTSYYRLKQTDFDGKFSYSQVVAVKFVETGSLSVFPNPAQQSIQLSFMAGNNESIFMQVFDARGTIVQSHNYFTGNEGVNNVNVDLSDTGAGVYFIALTTTTGVLTSKVIKE